MTRAITIDGFDAETGAWQHVATVLVDVPDTVMQVRASVGEVRTFGGDYTWHGVVRADSAPPMPPVGWSHPAAEQAGGAR